MGVLELPDIYLTDEEKPRKKNFIQETCPNRRSNPGPLRDRSACYVLSIAVDKLFLYCHLKTKVEFHNFESSALAQMVTCLPLVRQVWSSISGEVENFIMKYFKLQD